jgi:hypothetical protein
MVGFADSVNVLLSVVVILERILTQVEKLSKEICTVPEQVVSSVFVVIEVLSIAILKVIWTEVFAITPVAESAGEVDVTEGNVEPELAFCPRPRILAITPIRLGLGLLTSNGERFAFKQCEKVRKKKTIMNTVEFFIF